jgi:hypothetical protein
MIEDSQYEAFGSDAEDCMEKEADARTPPHGREY